MADSEDLFPNPPDDFRPVGLGWTVDGRGLYICDWQHRDNKEDVDAGRLWRMTWTGDGVSPPRPEWWQPLALGKLVAALPQELIEAFNHPSLSVRITAQRALSARASDSASNEILSQLIAVLIDEAASWTAQTHALWALDASDGGLVARGEIMRAAKGPSADLAAQALRQLSQRMVTAASEIGIEQLAHEAPTVRLQAPSWESLSGLSPQPVPAGAVRWTRRIPAHGTARQPQALAQR